MVRYGDNITGRQRIDFGKARNDGTNSMDNKGELDE